MNNINDRLSVKKYIHLMQAATDFRRKGPLKENAKDPIVGMGLLLEANQIPMGMKLYPGNESEKPVLSVQSIEK